MRAKKSLGQNFLRDESVAVRIVSALAVKSDEAVIEIGPGLGALTRHLIDSAGQVAAIEFDRDMIEVLTERFGMARNFQLINSDALTVDFASIVQSKAKLVANLPYNISTPILQRLIERRAVFSVMVLMFQREVVERITAAPGGKERGFLSVLVEEAFNAEYLFDVPPRAFSPVPKVWSSVVRLSPKPQTDLDAGLFRKIVSASFAQKRKTLSNNLKSVLKDSQNFLAAAGIDGTRRAETLTLDEWRSLTASLSTGELLYSKPTKSTAVRLDETDTV